LYFKDDEFHLNGKIRCEPRNDSCGEYWSKKQQEKPDPIPLATPAVQSYHFNMFKILIIILILFSTNISAFGVQEKECKEYKEISGSNYWHWLAYPGVFYSNTPHNCHCEAHNGFYR